MGRAARKKENTDIISALAERYPDAFSVIPHEVVPLVENIVDAIFYDIGQVPIEYKKRIHAAVSWYMSWPIYVQSVAFGECRRNLSGHRLERPTIAERELARTRLKECGFWTKRMDMVFKVNMGRKEAANR